MQIVFHAGFHKTGTSSLQRALVEHAPALAGIAHVETRKNSAGLSAAAEAARALSVTASAANLAALRARLTEWVAGLPELGGRALVASSEDFSGHMPGRMGLTDYRAARLVVPEVVQALIAGFPGARITVLYTTRDAEPWLTSLHWQLAKHPEMLLKQRRFCREYAGAADFAAILDPLAAALGGRVELRAVPLESLKDRRLGPVEAVYDVLAVSAGLRESLAVVANANVAPPVGLADHFVTLNRAGLSPDELKRSKNDLALLMQAYPQDER